MDVSSGKSWSDERSTAPIASVASIAATNALFASDTRARRVRPGRDGCLWPEKSRRLARPGSSAKSLRIACSRARPAAPVPIRWPFLLASPSSGRSRSGVSGICLQNTSQRIEPSSSYNGEVPRRLLAGALLEPSTGVALRGWSLPWRIEPSEYPLAIDRRACHWTKISEEPGALSGPHALRDA